MASELIKVVHLDNAILFLQQRPFAFGVYLNFRKKPEIPSRAISRIGPHSHSRRLQFLVID